MTRKFALLVALFGLAACETVEGFGKDVQAGGQAIEETAEESQAY